MHVRVALTNSNLLLRPDIMAKKADKINTRIRGALDVFRGRRKAYNINQVLEAARIGGLLGRRARDSYDAGKTGRLREDWGTSTDVPYYELASSHKKIRARSRELYKNDSTYRAAINAIVNRVVGKGLRPKPRVVDYENKPNLVINKQLEIHARRYFETIDWDAGRRHRFVGEGQRLALKTQLISGDVLLNAVNVPIGNHLPIAWQMVEIDRLQSSQDYFTRTFENSKDIKQTVHGINLNEYGAPVSYWFKGVDKPVSAKNIIHSFLQERPEQYIGEPLGTAILDSVYDKHDLDEDYVLKSRAVAKFLWWLSTLADKWPYSGDQDSDGYVSMDALTQMRSDEMPDIFKMPDNVSQTIEPLLRMKKHDVCSGMGLSYISVLLDMSGVNFAAASMNDIKEHINMGVLRDKFIGSFCQPMWEKFVRSLVIDGRREGVTPLRFESDVYHYTRCEWTGDAREYADPSKTARARIENIQAGRISLTEDLAERGKDVVEHIKEMEKERALLVDAGIKIENLTPREEVVEESDTEDEETSDQIVEESTSTNGGN